MDIYTNVTRIANERGVSIAKLEREAGIANGAIGKWRTQTPKVETVAKVAEYFGVTIDELVKGDE